MAVTTRSRFWGPLFPDVWDVAGRTFWGPLFPDPGPALDLVTPTGPAGVATFVLDLDAQLDVTLEWETDVFKAYEGAETRAAMLDNPRQRFKGSVFAIGDAVRLLRTQLQRWAAGGATFLLGLPYEALLLAADAASTTLTVKAGALANCDWANPGQRVVIVSGARTAVNAIVQSASGTSIVLDIAPGAIGKAGGYVMPTVPIYLEPQQAFARYTPADGIERWTLDAIAATFGWQKQPVAAELAGLNTGTSGVLDDLFFQARTLGAAGNNIRVSLDDQSLAGVDFAEVGNDIAIHWQAGVSTIGDLVAAINASSSLIKIIGSWNPATLLTSVADEFEFLNLTGGSDGDYATEGAGAVIATHAAHPVFDRRLVVDSTSDDSLQAMNEIVELGGVPVNRAQAAVPDWGRRVAIETKLGGEWQWTKRFLGTVFGAQKTFWLPSWRADLIPTATGVNTLTIENPTLISGGITSGAPADFFTWYATHQDIQIVQVDGTITRATITNAVDNGDGTITLTIGVTLSGSAIEMVSWLELCHFDGDTFTVRFSRHLFALDTTARAVTQ